jgi:LysM repeat protein
LYSIAQKYNTTVDKIKKDNNLDSNVLTIGNILLVEGNNQIVEECFGEEFSLSTDFFVYIVQRGDSLYGIAKKFNTTILDIQRLNNLENTNLMIGDELKIPVINSDDITYIVKKGESLYSIAKKFNTTVNDIKIKNNLDTNLLSIGQKLII